MDADTDTHEVEDEKRKKQLLAHLFGEDSDEDEASDHTPAPHPVSTQTPAVKPKSPTFGSDDEAEPTQKASQQASQDPPASQPRPSPLQRQKSSGGVSSAPLNIMVPAMPKLPEEAKIYLVNLSNMLSINPEPFDASSWTGDDIKPVVVERQGVPTVVQKTENVIRWRHVSRNGTLVPQSNTRLVRWSDGSYSLHIGKQALAVVEEKTKEHHLLCAKAGNDLLVSQAKAEGRLKISATDISAITARLQRQHQVHTTTRRKAKVVTAFVDPEKEKREQEQMEEERLKVNAMMNSAKRKRNEYGEDDQLTEEFLEGEDVAATKARFKKGSRVLDNPDLENEFARRALAAKSGSKAKRPKTREIEEDEEEDLLDDDDMDVSQDDDIYGSDED